MKTQDEVLLDWWSKGADVHESIVQKALFKVSPKKRLFYIKRREFVDKFYGDD